MATRDGRRLEGFAVILGVSSGFGEATALALAEAGMDIMGVHLDRRATMPHVAEIREKIHGMGREAWFYNINAADDEKRAATLDDFANRLTSRADGAGVRVLMHSLAFGTLRPTIARPNAPENELTRANVEMTLDVMANSLLYWTQDILRRGMFTEHARVWAMTSTGSRGAWPEYGAVSAAKASLEAYVRQLAVEGATRGFTANAICAGVTMTPALTKIPGHEEIAARAVAKNPWKRLTTPADVAATLVALASKDTYWLNGNVINVDGGEAVAG